MKGSLRRRLASLVRVERHTLGPRLHVFGLRVHEYHFGFAILAACPAASLEGPSALPMRTAAAALAGLWLVIKDWPDLFAATRDTASWRLGLHRLPRETTWRPWRRRERPL